MEIIAVGLELDMLVDAVAQYVQRAEDDDSFNQLNDPREQAKLRAAKMMLKRLEANQKANQ